MEDKDNNNDDDRCRLPPRPPGDVPWLVYTHGNSRKKKIQTFCTFYDLNNNNNNNSDYFASYIKSIPELRSKRICTSYGGWLVLRDHGNPTMFSLWHVLTSQSLNLPPLPFLPVSDDDGEAIRLSNCALTSPLLNSDHTDSSSSAAASATTTTTTTDDCVLALFFGDQLFWCRPTLNRNASINWVNQPLHLNDRRLEKIHHSAIVNGVIYSWADEDAADNGGVSKKLVRLQVDDDLNLLTLKSLEMMRPNCGYACLHNQAYLVESCGQLYCVSVSIRLAGDDNISVISVWELDLLARNWVQVKSLDGRAFFLGDNCCTWCWGSNSSDPTESSLCSSSSVGGVQGDCVYFIDTRNDVILCSYNLAEGSVTQFQTCLNLQSAVISAVWLNVITPKQHQFRKKQNKKTGHVHVPKTPTIRHLKDRNKKTQHVHINKEKIGDYETTGTPGTESLLMTKLPNDMISLISDCYLHLFDYDNFRASCKTLQSLVLPLSQKRSRTSKLLPLPMFVSFKDNDTGLCQIIDPSRDYSYYINHLQLDSDPFTVEFSKDGWLGIYNPYWESIRFFNVFTRACWYFSLDELLIVDLRSVAFSTNPDSPDCVTVVFSNHIDEPVYIHYIRYNDETWNTCEFDNEVDRFWPGRSSPVYFAGAFYVLGVDGRLGEFKLVADGEESWRVYRRPDTPWNNFHSYHLVECDGDLLGVFVGHMGMWIQVFKFNLSTRKWYRVKSLGNYSLFVSNHSSVSIQPTESWMRNMIYVPRLKGNSIVYFSLDTGRYHVARNEDDSFKNYFGTTEPLHCFWFLESCNKQ